MTHYVVQQSQTVIKEVPTDGVEAVGAGGDLTVDNSNPKIPIVVGNFPVKSLSGSGGVTVTDQGLGEFSISYTPLAPFPVQRVNTSQTLPAIVGQYVVSASTTGPITLTLPPASSFPVAEQYYPLRFVNVSNQDVTFKIQNGGTFFNAPDEIILKGNRNDTLNLNAANFTAGGGFPAFAGWEKDQSPIKTYFTAKFTGSVDMSEFEGVGEDIAYREGTTTDNPTVFQLDSSNETQILISHRGTISGNTTATIDAQGFGPTYNVDMIPRIFRNGAFINVDLGASRTGNFAGEDTHISQPFTCDVEPGDQLRVLLTSSGVNGDLLAATIQFSMVV